MANNIMRDGSKKGGSNFSLWWPKDYKTSCRSISPADADGIINNVSTDWLLLLEIKPEGYELTGDDGQYKTLRMFSTRPRQTSLVAWMEDEDDNILDTFWVGHFNGKLNKYLLTLEDFQELMILFCRKDEETDFEDFLITHCRSLPTKKAFRLWSNGRKGPKPNYYKVTDCEAEPISQSEYEDLQAA